MGATQVHAFAVRVGIESTAPSDDKLLKAENATPAIRSSLAIGARLQRERMEQEKPASAETKASAPKP